MLHRVTLMTLPAALLTLAACHESPAAPDLSARVVSIMPAGGATGVDPQAPIVITFDHPMRNGMEQYARVYEGDLTGPVVLGTWTWSGDRTVVTFVPAQPFKALTHYTVHLGGGMRAADGEYVDYGPCIAQHGGEWATQNMMGGGMMGNGWQHPNGTYGMVFTFTTA